MQESIIIKNFGPVKHIEIEDIRPFTVLIGESGSGKSTIMKIIVLFRWIYKMLNIRSYLKYANISRSPFKFDFQACLNNSGFSDYIKNQNPEIIYKKGSTTIHYKSALRTSNLVLENELSLEKMSFISEKRNLIPDILAGYKTDMSFFLNETFNDFTLSIKEVNKLVFDYLGVEYFTELTPMGVKHKIKNIDGTGNYQINLENASSGMQTITPLAVIVENFARHYDFNSRFNNIVLDYLSRNDSLKDFRTAQNIGDIKHRNVHIHIEEPELSLYPESQRSLINFIVNRCFVENHKDYNMTVMMATHSPYIINHLNLLIKANDKNKLVEGAKLNYDDVSVYQVDEGEIFDLKIANKKLINTNPLSETINDIYEEYNQL
jgi:predicted ATPase